MTALNILHGWEEFMDAHGLNDDPLRKFGVYMTTAANSRRQARTEVADCIMWVARDIRKACALYNVPLWPAIVPAESDPSRPLRPSCETSCPGPSPSSHEN